MKKKLYKDSPLNALGQGVHDLLKYEMIKQASGQFDPVGESLFSLGEMFASKSWDGEEKPEGLDLQSIANKKALENATAQEEPFKADTTAMDEYLGAKEIKLLTPNPRPAATTPDPDPIDQETKVITTGLGNGAQIGRDVLGLRGTGMADARLTGAGDQVSTPGNELLSSQAIEEAKNKSRLTYSGLPGTFSPVSIPKPKSMANRLKDSESPLDRMNPEKLKALKGLMYNTSNGDSPLRRISHMMNSPFLKTDEGPDLEKVDFRYMKRATSTGIGKLGGAASAGYNLVIDAKNYETAVKNDYDEELSEGMGELVQQLDKTNPNYEHDMFELASAKKKQYADGFAQYAAGNIDRLTWENQKMSLKGDLENHGKALNIVAAQDKEFAENKGDHNVGASDENITDYYNTRMKNPDSFSVKTINGVDTYVGKTLQGKEVSMPISMIANGSAKMQLVPQYDFNKAVNAGLKVMQAFTVEGNTALGQGNRNLDKNNPEEAAQLREMGVAAISREIGADETRLRSILADKRQLNFRQFEQLVDAKGGSRKENLQGLLQEMSQEIYDENVVDSGGYQAKSQTRFRAQQPRQYRSSDRERRVAQTTAQINQLPEFSVQTMGQYQSMIPANLKYKIKRDSKGNFGVVNEKNETVTRLDSTDPQAVKRAIANLSGVKGYETGGAADDAYNKYLDSKK